jgi:hypothetical protein
MPTAKLVPDDTAPIVPAANLGDRQRTTSSNVSPSSRNWLTIEAITTSLTTVNPERSMSASRGESPAR